MTEQQTIDQPTIDERDIDEPVAAAPAPQRPSTTAIAEAGQVTAAAQRPAMEAAASGPAGTDRSTTPLFDESAASDLRGRWADVQAGFVDEPRSSVEHADALVAEVMQRLAQEFSGERKRLEGQWSRGDDVSTEDLRIALQRYRAFFDRLLSI